MIDIMKKQITKEQLEELYIKQNLSTSDLAEYYKVAGKTIRYWLKKYNISKPKELTNQNRQEKRKQNNLQKYGVEHTSQLKENRAKMKTTCLERYGVDNAAKSEIIKEKTKQNNLQKYGETNPLKVAEIKERVRLQQISTRGYAYPYQLSKNMKAVKILSTKESLEEYLNSFNYIPTIYELCEKLEYSHCALLSRIKELGLLDKVQYFPEGSWSQRFLPKESIQIMTNKDKLKEYLETFDDKPTLSELSDLLQYDRSTIGQRIQEYELQKLIKYGSTTSSYEKELKRIFPDMFHKDRTILSPLEIDLYCSEYKLGIEFNGNYWHSIDNKGKNYHQNKSLAAINKGIRLIHIFEYEWQNKYKKNKIISMINNIVDDDRQGLYARQCIVKEISSKVAKEFLNRFHLQGEDTAPVRLGLFYEEELVAVMTFAKPRFNKNYEWELSRLCFHSDFKITGGAEKLIKYFERVYHPKNIITYCDISKFTGEVYKRLGFTLDSISKPDYIWCNRKNEVITRYQDKKHKLIEKFPQYKDLSETEIMTYLGYWRIEDSGNKIWIKNL